MCGAEIRYGRFCPECSAKLSRDNSSMVYVEGISYNNAVRYFGFDL
jgi:hypothetical protein